MWPFFTFYGGKWRAAPHYPLPTNDIIIEPFAGAAGFATRYPDRKVILYDLDPVIAGIWNYLIHVSQADIRSLPIDVTNVDDLNIPQEAKWLIGFWLNKGAASPCKTPSLWMRQKIRPNSFWGEAIRSRIATQVTEIRHWIVKNEAYSEINNITATWFIDPPYSVQGRYYRYNSVDYGSLGAWCESRHGQVIVCEQEGAEWLPFQPFRTIKANEGGNGKRFSNEVIWVNE